MHVSGEERFDSNVRLFQSPVSFETALMSKILYRKARKATSKPDGPAKPSFETNFSFR
jgi:hypothetical protein